jgi:hypothetical protein
MTLLYGICEEAVEMSYRFKHGLTDATRLLTGRERIDRVAERRVTEAALGAWLLKGNADRSDLVQRFARDPGVTRWCVQPGYRARLMRAGQPVVLWISGNRGRLPYGVGGLGQLTGAAVVDAEHGGWWVPLDLTVMDQQRWVRRDELRSDPRLAGIEVFRQPQAGNPSFLTAAEFAALRDHLG